MRNTQDTSAGTVDFFDRFNTSERFERVFNEGMGLVEETANYLDGPGRTESRELDRTGAIAYATESMRLTTRLMQLASWLLLQRAVSTGEVSRDEAGKEKSRVNLAGIGAGNPIPGAEKLPQGLVDLVGRSLRLHERIQLIDTQMTATREHEAADENPVATQLSQLARAFGAR